MKIKVLSDQTINEIAAGEVVENPSAVVKELVENAIDAKAKKITIEIKGGGHFLIRVIDDGSGMSSDDATLAFERHATSKILSANDLMSIVSMGFRGEALASIAAVAKVTLITCDTNEIGTKVVCHGGKMFVNEPCVRSPGTTIEVAALFYNVPARKKFQKSAARSTSEIVRMITKLSLAHPEVEFHLTSAGKTMVKANKDMFERVGQVLGSDFIEGAKKFKFEENGHIMAGYVGAPPQARVNRSGQYLFINHRPVFSPLISKAVKEAYATRIGSKLHPNFVLWIEVPPEMIDVNVHPQKSEIRFQEPGMMTHLVCKAVESALVPRGGIKLNLSLGEETPKFSPLEEEVTTFKRDRVEKPAFDGALSTTSSVVTPLIPIREAPMEVFDFQPERDNFELMEVWGIFRNHAIVKFEKGHPFLIEEGVEEKLVAIDLRGSESRIGFDGVVARLNGESEKELQSLLFSQTFQFTAAEAKIISDHLEILEKLGMEIRPFGNNCFVLEAIAPYLSSEKCQEVLTALVDEFQAELNPQKIAAVISKYTRTKTYSKHEVKPLLQELLKTSDPYHSPNGKLLVKEWIS